MKKKIYTRMTIISVIFTIITMIASVGIFYNIYRSQVMEDLKTHVHILKTTEAVLEYIEKDFDPKIDNLRITVTEKLNMTVMQTLVPWTIMETDRKLNRH